MPFHFDNHRGTDVLKLQLLGAAFGLSPPWPVLSFDGKALSISRSQFCPRVKVSVCSAGHLCLLTMWSKWMLFAQTSAEFGFHSSFLLLCNWWKKKFSTRGAVLPASANRAARLSPCYKR